MSPALIVYFLRMILCNDVLMKWLREEAAKSTTPLDDWAVQAICSLLCQKE